MHGNEEPSFEVRCIPKYKYSDQLEPIVSEIKVAQLEMLTAGLKQI